MSAGLLAQYAVIALAVLASLLFVVHRQAPALSRWMRIRVALPLVRDGRPDWMRALGRRLAPPIAALDRGRCGGCDGCGPKG